MNLPPNLPVLWSFRRCPYAMRARLGLALADIRHEWCEILLRDKPEAFLAVSNDGTVPVLELGEKKLQESLDILLFALSQNDPDALLTRYEAELVAENDGSFKSALDRYKYASRHDVEPAIPRGEAKLFLQKLNERLREGFLHGAKIGASDYAILPFIRQFAHVDLNWFEAQDWPHLVSWLNRFKSSEFFAQIMQKQAVWKEGATPIVIGNREIRD